MRASIGSSGGSAEGSFGAGVALSKPCSWVGATPECSAPRASRTRAAPAIATSVEAVGEDHIARCRRENEHAGQRREREDAPVGGLLDLAHRETRLVTRGLHG